MSVVDLSIRSMMCTPLLINDAILGLVQVDTCTTPRGFTAEDLQVLTGISAQAAIAVKNLQLYEAIEAETARRISLQRYFSPGLVDMLMSGEVTATLGGDAYQGTILLADIIGFTAMSEKMPPLGSWQSSTATLPLCRKSSMPMGATSTSLTVIA